MTALLVSPTGMLDGLSRRSSGAVHTLTVAAHLPARPLCCHMIVTKVSETGRHAGLLGSRTGVVKTLAVAVPPRRHRFRLTAKLVLAIGSEVGRTQRNIGVALIRSEHATHMTATKDSPIGSLVGQTRRRLGAVISLPEAAQTLQPLLHMIAMQDFPTGTQDGPRVRKLGAVIITKLAAIATIAALALVTGPPNGLEKNKPGVVRKQIAAVLRRRHRSHMTVMLVSAIGRLDGPLLRSTTAARYMTVLATLMIATKAYRIGDKVGTLRRRPGAVRITIKAVRKTKQVFRLTARLASAIGGRDGQHPRRRGAVPTKIVVASEELSLKGLYPTTARPVTVIGKQGGLILRSVGVAQISTKVAPK